MMLRAMVLVAMGLFFCKTLPLGAQTTYPRYGASFHYVYPTRSWVAFPACMTWQANIDAKARVRELPDSVTLDLESSDEELGIVLGGGRYPKGTPLQIMAVAAADVHFVGWSDDEKANPRLLRLDEDLQLEARFKPCKPSDDEEGLETVGAELQVRGRRVYIKGAAGFAVHIYDERGRCVLTERRTDDHEVGYPLPEPGVYYVQIGAVTANKITIE